MIDKGTIDTNTLSFGPSHWRTALTTTTSTQGATTRTR